MLKSILFWVLVLPSFLTFLVYFVVWGSRIQVFHEQIMNRLPESCRRNYPFCSARKFHEGVQAYLVDKQTLGEPHLDRLRAKIVRSCSSKVPILAFDLSIVFMLLVGAIDLVGAPWWAWLVIIGVPGIFIVIFHFVLKQMLKSIREEFAFPGDPGGRQR